jgi:DNA-binding LytR/AlgR family response regulator
MTPVLSAQQSLDQARTTGVDRGSIDQLRALYESLSQDVILCKRFLEDLLVLQAGSKKKPYLNKILVKSNRHLIIIATDNIYWIEAWGDYIRLHCNGKSHLIRRKICDIATRLDPQRFLRIGRSAIINIEHIKELEPLNHGDYLITLVDNTQLNLSRNCRDRLSAMFDNSL